MITAYSSFATGPPDKRFHHGSFLLVIKMRRLGKKGPRRKRVCHSFTKGNVVYFWGWMLPTTTYSRRLHRVTGFEFFAGAYSQRQIFVHMDAIVSKSSKVTHRGMRWQYSSGVRPSAASSRSCNSELYNACRTRYVDDHWHRHRIPLTVSLCLPHRVALRCQTFFAIGRGR